MNKKEIIFFAIIAIILLICVITMPQYYSVFIFLLVLAILFIIMSLFVNYKRRFENRTLSLISYAVSIILFLVYFANCINMNIPNKDSTDDGSLILLLFILTMLIGWLLEKNIKS
ncbi:MAG: hypothetical protein IJ122_08655 [Methanobrevibacter sp.]|nr:hypothetical protein [Methanobrevibacter sp.]